MSDILLSNPLIHLYLLYVAALLIATFWPGPSKPSGQGEDRRLCSSGRGIRRPQTSGMATRASPTWCSGTPK
jgi:hypothetical protein